MTKIIMSGFLSMKRGHSEWLQRYMVIVGGTLAWYHKKSELKNKMQPMGVMPLTRCILSVNDADSKYDCFSITKQQQNNAQTVFKFKCDSSKEIKRWIKCLKICIDDCKLIQSAPMAPTEAQAFGIYRNSLSLFEDIQDGSILIESESSDIGLGGSQSIISSVSNPDDDVPMFYSTLYKRRSIWHQQVVLLGDIIFEWRQLVSEQKLKALQEIEEEFTSLTNVIMSRRNAQTSDDDVMNTKNHPERRQEMVLAEDKHFIELIEEDMKSESSDETTQLIRESLSLANMDLEDFRFDVNLTPVSEKSVIRQNRFFYSCGNEAKEVYVQLCRNMIHQYEDGECQEEIGRIDFRSITNVCLIDEDTFELNTALQDKVHVFAFYDFDSHNAEDWVADIEIECGIKRIDMESTYSSSYYETTKSASVEEILLPPPPPIPIEPEPKSWYAIFCWWNPIKRLFYPRTVVFRECD